VSREYGVGDGSGFGGQSTPVEKNIFLNNWQLKKSVFLQPQNFRVKRT
jgi:hypothetical protein